MGQKNINLLEDQFLVSFSFFSSLSCLLMIFSPFSIKRDVDKQIEKNSCNRLCTVFNYASKMHVV